MPRKVNVLSIVLLSTTTLVAAIFINTETRQKMQDCVLNDPSIQEDFANCYVQMLTSARPWSNVQNTVSNVCSLLNPATCLEDHYNNIAVKCLGEKQLRPAFQMSLNMLRAGYNYACDEQGAKIKEFVVNDGVECMERLLSNKAAMLACIKETIEEIDLEITKAGDDLEQVRAVECRQMARQKDCVTTKMDCSNDKPVEIIEGFYRVMENEMACPAAKTQHAQTKQQDSNRIQQQDPIPSTHHQVENYNSQGQRLYQLHILPFLVCVLAVMFVY